MHLFTKILLFISSYSLLFLIFCLKWLSSIKDIHGVFPKVIVNHFIFSIIFFIIIFIIFFASLSYYLLIIRTRKKDIRMRKRVISIKPLNNNVLTNFLVSLLLPIAGLSIQNKFDVIIIIIILAIIFSIFKQGDLFYINPILLIFGFKIYEVNIINPNAEENTSTSAIILTRKNQSKYPNLVEVNLFEISKNVYFDS